MRRRFPSLSLRRGGNVDAPYVTIDSEQTIRLNRKRTGLILALFRHCTVQGDALKALKGIQTIPR